MNWGLSANIRTRLLIRIVSALLFLAVAGTGRAETETRLLMKFHGPQPFHGAAMPIPDQATRAAVAAAPANTKRIVLYNFVSPPRGAYPAAGVVRDSAGNLYGTTNGAYSDAPGGGAHNAGVVFKIDPSGCETVLYSFTGGADGSSPNGVILDPAGNLYGTTSGGGAAGAGVVFKIDVTGRETVLYSFTGGSDGSSPNIVILGSKGDLYGTTSGGGGSDAGVVFDVDTSGHETVLYSFTGGADGGQPLGEVALDSADNFYGTTNIGGKADSGVVFKINSSGHETVLYSFTGAADGAYPNGVMRDVQGNLYGTTTNGGGAAGAGVVFKVDTSGHESVLYSFTGGNDGGYSDAGVARDSKGNLYGTTNSGGAAGQGVVFKVNPSGHETVLHSFERGPDGDLPDSAGVILDSQGNLYGTTAFGGAGNAGVVYKLDVGGHETVLYGFPGAAEGQYPFYSGVSFASDGNLYGTTELGGSGGAGVVYRLDGDGNETVLYSFDLLTANGFGRPTGAVVRDWDGNLYGTTFIGPANLGYSNGVVYKVDTAGHAKALHSFTGGADGSDPYGNLILDSDCNLYGTASGGGASGQGVVFKIDPSGHETVLYTFTGGADGGGPLAGVIRDRAGNLYGTTNGGGTSGAGVVFKLEPSGKETPLYSFKGEADGGYPLFSGVILDRDGNLFGTTAGGGKSDAGVVFKVDKSGSETVLYSFTGGGDGDEPASGVTLGPAGKLYGTTALGGRTNAGVVFEIKP